MMLREQMGRVAGALLAPAVVVGEAVRHSRLLHPSGVVVRAHATPCATEAALAPLARRLGGDGVVRFSGALWKGQARRPDLLGCALRLCAPGRVLAPGPQDQDLLFATARTPWTMGLALLTTDTGDYLANDYFAMSPFVAEDVGTVKLRLRAAGAERDAQGADRVERLEAALGRGQARLTLELKRHPWPGPWIALVELQLGERLELDQAALRFDPFRSGRGLHPSGFIHSLRRATYPSRRRSLLHRRTVSP